MSEREPENRHGHDYVAELVGEIRSVLDAYDGDAWGLVAKLTDVLDSWQEQDR